MTDKVFTAFLTRQRDEGLALAAASDLLDLVPIDGAPHQRYLADFRCTGLVQTEAGEIVEADRFLVGIWFPDDYLREVDPFRILSCLEPRRIFHPNVNAPFLCSGRIAPATSLVELLYRTFEIITYNRVTMREDDALNKPACSWTRGNRHRLPVDTRPLKRRSGDVAVDFDIVPVEVQR